MIVDALIRFFVTSLGTLINGVLPKIAVTFVTIVSTTMTRIGGYLHFVNGWIPVTTLIAWFSIWAVVLPAMAAYVLFDWLYRHIPMIAGFGVGSG